MKRKKWTEEEERTLLSECSSLLSSGSLARLRTREKKFQPIAERVNAAHHLRDPAAFPFRWSWRDVSVKVQNMRHQYLGVKLKILRRDTDSFDWDHGLLLWPNFLRYKQVFGDLPLDRSTNHPAASPSDIDLQIHSHSHSHSDSDDNDDDNEARADPPHVHSVNNKNNDHHHHHHHLHHHHGGEEVDDAEVLADRDGGKLGGIASRVAELGEMELKREERRREREAAREEENEEKERRRRERRHRREVERWRTAVEEEERRERRRRKWEERREEEEMEWREKVLVMRMEHERQVMQMNADACQAQMHVLAILVRLVCQFLGPGASGGDGGLAGLAHQVMHNLQQQQQEQESPESLVGDDGKNDAHSAGHYL